MELYPQMANALRSVLPIAKPRSPRIYAPGGTGRKITRISHSREFFEGAGKWALLFSLFLAAMVQIIFKLNKRNRGLNIQQIQFSEDIFREFAQRGIAGNLFLEAPGSPADGCFPHP